MIDLYVHITIKTMKGERFMSLNDLASALSGKESSIEARACGTCGTKKTSPANTGCC